MKAEHAPVSARILFPFDLAWVRLDRGLKDRLGANDWRREAVALCLLTDGVYRLGGTSLQPIASPLVIRSAVSQLARIGHRGPSSCALLYFGRGLVDQLVAACGADRVLARFISGFLSAVASVHPVGYSLGAQGGSTARDIIARIDMELGRRLPGYQSAVVAQLLELLVLVHRERSTQPVSSGPAVSERMAAICAHLEQHYDHEFTLEELAGRCMLSASHFSHVFRSYAGVPVFEYLNRVRIGRACVLLRNSNRGVLDIAYQVGYNNISFFNRYFRRVMGMAPGDYRKLVQR